jgi:cell wall-associated NlpC family hydrolase
MKDLTEAAWRAALVAEAKSWIGTPYISNGAVKGRRGGVDCAMILLAVYQNIGLIEKDFDPRPYPAQWHVNQNEEKYMATVLGFSYEVAGPPERLPLGGDVVLFKLGRVFCHGAIVTVWPNVVHAIGGDKVVPEDLSTNTTGKRALWPAEKRFFSFWK